MGSEVKDSSSTRLRAEGLSKTFGSARVLRDVDLEIEAGEIHALLGANGSGKSTLIKCITGVERPDPGARLEIDGHDVLGDYSTTVAHDLGVRVVHQEAPLIDSLTIAETVGHHRGFPTVGGLINKRRLARETRETFERLGLEVEPNALASTLSAPERAMLMLALALGNGDARLIVLDEPTASLTSGDAERFLKAVEVAARQGAGVLFVTHRLGEVFGICTGVTILRDGEVVRRTTTAEINLEGIVDEIVGPSVDRSSVGSKAVPARFLAKRSDGGPVAGAPATTALRAENLHAATVDDITMQVEAGEILGISGLLGSGASELCGLLSGAAPLRSGRVTIGGRDLPHGFNSRDAMAAGLSFVPGDRLREGGIGSLSLLDNITLPNLEYYGVSRRRPLDDFGTIVDSLDVRPPEPRRPFGTLSGGNQQKVIVGKWALMRPSVFLLDNPTAGVDPGAREDILALLRGLADAGTAVVVHSSEPEELSRLATRVLVIKEGRIVAELKEREVTERGITAAS
ncbi:MAG: sugar ABC transporter ATP-binding protein [Actinobacteria bacterium]|nr:sugar ABC transporter ATP-binding protein [Actinomycetota bacterium]